MKKQNKNPDHRITVVDNSFRKNTRSTTPGGATLVFEYSDGSLNSYENIKNIQAYINHCDLSDVVTIWRKADKPKPGTTSYHMTLIASYGETQHPKTDSET